MERVDKRRAIAVGILILVAYAVLASSFTDTRWVVWLAETISGLAVIGIAALMYPYFKRYDKVATTFYVFGKIIEGDLMIIAGLYTNLCLRESLYSVHTYVFIISAAIFYLLLYKSKLVPRFISVWGLVAVVCLLAANIMDGLGYSFLMILYLPIVLNEVFLAVWLMVKGFDIPTR